jgi:hypothetical protein
MLIHPEASGQQSHIVNRYPRALLELVEQSLIISFSFSLMKKKQKIKTWDFRPSTSVSLPKTQKLPR